MIEIRPIADGDFETWRRLWTLYLEFYETSVEEPVYETLWARLHDPDPHEFKGLVAVSRGEVVGFTHYLFHRHAWRIENVCYLQDLYVHDDARGLGAGRALIEAVYAEADAAGAPAVWWLTQEFNATARRLYDRIAKLTPFIRYNR